MVARGKKYLGRLTPTDCDELGLNDDEPDDDE